MIKQSNYKIKKVSIILPTYNEVENIIDLIKEIIKIIKYNKEIIVVDDNSPDGTSLFVRKYINKTKRKDVFIKTRVQNPGLTNSIRDGINMSRGDVIVWLDCDFSMPPSVINKLLKCVENGYDIAVGSRFINGGKIKELANTKKDSIIAILLSRLMNWSIQLLLGAHFKDYTSGFVAVKRKVFGKIKLRGDYGEYFIDFIYKSFAYKFLIVEVPYVCVSRVRGVSKTGNNIVDYMKRGIKYIALTFRLLLERHVLHRIL